MRTSPGELQHQCHVLAVCRRDFLSHIRPSHITGTGWPVRVTRKCRAVSGPRGLWWDVLGGGHSIPSPRPSFCPFCSCVSVKWNCQDDLTNFWGLNENYWGGNQWRWSNGSPTSPLHINRRHITSDLYICHKLSDLLSLKILTCIVFYKRPLRQIVIFDFWFIQIKCDWFDWLRLVIIQRKMCCKCKIIFYVSKRKVNQTLM